jgi:hypothetical protein
MTPVKAPGEGELYPSPRSGLLVKRFTNQTKRHNADLLTSCVLYGRVRGIGSRCSSEKVTEGKRPDQEGSSQGSARGPRFSRTVEESAPPADAGGRLVH